MYICIYMYISQDTWEAAAVWREFTALNACVRKKEEMN